MPWNNHFPIELRYDRWSRKRCTIRLLIVAQQRRQEFSNLRMTTTRDRVLSFPDTASSPEANEWMKHDGIASRRRESSRGVDGSKESRKSPWTTEGRASLRWPRLNKPGEMFSTDTRSNRNNYRTDCNLSSALLLRVHLCNGCQWRFVFCLGHCRVVGSSCASPLAHSHDSSVTYYLLLITCADRLCADY